MRPLKPSMTEGAPNAAIRHTAGAILTCLTLLTAATAGSQQMTVIVRHHPAPLTTDIDAQAFHRLPGRSAADSVNGLPPNIKLAETAPGEQVCYVVQGANPLLYTYSATTVDVPVTATPDTKEIADKFSAIIIKTAPPAPGAVGAAALSDLQEYQNRVAVLRDYLDSASTIKRESDEAASFAEIQARDTKGWAAIQKANQEAEKYYKALPAADRDKDMTKVHESFRAMALEHLKAAHTAVDAAAKQLLPGYNAMQVCRPMLKGRTKYFMTVKAREDAASLKPARRVAKDKEELAGFTLNPEYIERFRVAPGVFVAGLFGDDRDVGVENGTLSITKSSRTYTRTGMFAMGRVTNHLWPTLGAATSDGSSVDLYLGLQLRAGDFVFGPELSVGAGVAWMDVPVGAGALRQGDALPEAKKLEDVIEKDRRFGLGITFTITGLSFGNKDTEK
jgi:hypothetical protein